MSIHFELADRPGKQVRLGERFRDGSGNACSEDSNALVTSGSIKIAERLPLSFRRLKWPTPRQDGSAQFDEQPDTIQAVQFLQNKEDFVVGF